MSQYFENDKSIRKEERKIKIKVKNKEYSFYTDNGVFSKNKLDYGTKLLLENLPDLNGNILDLGCGYGIIGLILSYNKQLIIDMVDINIRALNLTKKNAKLNKIENVNIYESDIYSNVNKKYNYIITNPPIRVGKEILKKFLIDSYEYLNVNGELWFVMRKDHGVKTMIKDLEKIYNVEIMTRDKGFYIVKCINNKKV